MTAKSRVSTKTMLDALPAIKAEGIERGEVTDGHCFGIVFFGGDWDDYQIVSEEVVSAAGGWEALEHMIDDRASESGVIDYVNMMGERAWDDFLEDRRWYIERELDKGDDALTQIPNLVRMRSHAVRQLDGTYFELAEVTPESAAERHATRILSGELYNEFDFENCC